MKTFIERRAGSEENIS